METPYNRGMQFYSFGPGHMTKMAVMSIYGKKKPFKTLLQNQKVDDLGTWYVALGM